MSNRAKPNILVTGTDNTIASEMQINISFS